jgi:SEC-C motif-containing protein
MRARYTAYVTGDVDFIVKSYAPECTFAAAIDRQLIETWSKNSEWLGLDVIATEQGQSGDDFGVVEFVARYKLSGVKVEHRERAVFRKCSGRWAFIIDGAGTNGAATPSPD